MTRNSNRVFTAGRQFLALVAGLVLAACGVAKSDRLGAEASQVIESVTHEMHLSDEPGNWFKESQSGTPLVVANVGDRVQFRINDCCTDTRHTVTLLVKPDASILSMDQGSSQKGSLQAEFDQPGVYVFTCKIHPYMVGVVAVLDENGAIPAVTDTALPFIGHLGVSSLDPLTVLSVMRSVAASDADKRAKWDIRESGDPKVFTPATPGVGEIWVNTQFEAVMGQAKPGTITVVDAASFAVEREIDGLAAQGMWNNPHNMWANFELDAVYNANWFGRWINKIDRASGAILGSIEVGEAPTHIISNPNLMSGEFGVLHIPLSAEDGIVKVEDTAQGLVLTQAVSTGSGNNHPHGHWLTCGQGPAHTVVPNVFQGEGFEGSISILDTETGAIEKEFSYDAADPLRSALLMPIAVGECHVGPTHTHKAYVSNVVTGMVTVIKVHEQELVTNIPVTLTPDGQLGQNLLHTLQAPIQTPVSPDGKWVATAVLSLTSVPRAATGSADHVAIIDARTDQVVAMIGTDGGTHGINWGAKLGGGYYAYVTNQFANTLTVIDPDPNGDDDGTDAAIAGNIILADGDAFAGATDGTGGQGIKPLPMVHDGWIQPTVNRVNAGQTSAEVAGWIDQLTFAQKNPQ